MAQFLDLTHRLEYRRIESSAGVGTPTLVFLHHGLGSVSTWRDFPDRAAALTKLPALVYSRFGYGRSDAAPPVSRGPDFMHREVLEVLPDVLSALAIERPILVGHSDGASIAIIYAGSDLHPRPCALALLAPHVFVEDRTSRAPPRRAPTSRPAGCAPDWPGITRIPTAPSARGTPPGNRRHSVRGTSKMK